MRRRDDGRVGRVSSGSKTSWRTATMMRMTMMHACTDVTPVRVVLSCRDRLSATPQPARPTSDTNTKCRWEKANLASVCAGGFVFRASAWLSSEGGIPSPFAWIAKHACLAPLPAILICLLSSLAFFQKGRSGKLDRGIHPILPGRFFPRRPTPTADLPACGGGERKVGQFSTR